MQQTSALLNISQVPGSISSVLQIHSGKHCPSTVPPESRSSPTSQCRCLFFPIALLLWRDSNSLGGVSKWGCKWQLWGAEAVTAAFLSVLPHGALPRQPGADTGGRRQLQPAVFLHNLAYCPIQIHKKSCTLPVY